MSAELPSRTFCTFPREFSSPRRTGGARPLNVFEELNDLSEPPDDHPYDDDGAPSAAL